jgi:hypothetical protein
MTDLKTLLTTTAAAAILATGSFAGDSAVKIDADADASVETSAEVAVEETGEALEAGANAVAEAGKSAADAVEDTATEVASDVADAAKATGTWIEERFGELAERPVDHILGADVHLANGEDVGEVDNIGIKDGTVVALLGIGGIFGLAENNVAIDMQELAWDGEKFILDGYTQEQLSEMPEYDSAEVRIIEDTDVALKAAVRM